MSVRVEQFEGRTASDQILRDFYLLWTKWDTDAVPGDEPMPYEQYEADLRNYLKNRLQPKWLLYDDGFPAAIAGLFMDPEQNVENAHGFIHVHPDYRGRGHVRTIGAAVVDELEANGRIRFGTGIPEPLDGHGLAKAVGLKEVFRDRRSRLVIADVDRVLVKQWIERAPERAADYEVLFYESPMPDDILDDFVELQHVMNTAPREDYVEEDEVFTAEEWRNRESDAEARQEKIFTYIARHVPTGTFAGYTNIVYQSLWPAQAWQWDTGVSPEHRNKGLGRWLKAAMLDKLMTELPDVERIDTFNAGSNEPMLNINVELGFAPLVETPVYQGPTASIREWLDRGPSGD